MAPGKVTREDLAGAALAALGSEREIRPMRLLDGDFPDRAFMHSVIEHNLSQALALCPVRSRPR